MRRAFLFLLVHHGPKSALARPAFLKQSILRLHLLWFIIYKKERERKREKTMSSFMFLARVSWIFQLSYWWIPRTAVRLKPWCSPPAIISTASGFLETISNYTTGSHINNGNCSHLTLPSYNYFADTGNWQFQLDKHFLCTSR